MLDGLHRRAWGIRWPARRRLQTYRPQATAATRPAQGCRLGRAAGGPRDRESPALADRHLSRCQPRATAGVSGRVRFPTQSTQAAYGGFSNPARPWQRARANILPPHPGRARYVEVARRGLIPTSSSVLKQPDKQEPTTAVDSRSQSQERAEGGSPLLDDLQPSPILRVSLQARFGRSIPMPKQLRR